MEPLKLKDAEAAFQFTDSFVNEMEVIDGDRTFSYIGRAHNLFMDGLDIRGAVSLEKVEKITETKRVKVKVGGFFSRQYRYRETVVVTEKQVWLVDTGKDNNGWACDYFVSRGESRTERDQGYTYRGALIGKLANNKILVSDALLDAVFGPIDQKLLEVYNTVKNFGEFPKK